MARPILILGVLVSLFGGLFFVLNQNNKSDTMPPQPSTVVLDAGTQIVNKPEQPTEGGKPAPEPKAAMPATTNKEEISTGGNNETAISISTTPVCNASLIGSDGLDRFKVVSEEACDLVNDLYKQGKAAGNIGDTYENRDGLHVNLCEDWTPNPDCPFLRRFFLQHEWLISGGVGRALRTFAGVVVGQASFSGVNSGYVKHSIAYAMYEDQRSANILYSQYTHNNLYIYPSLEESKSDNIANTPYVISSESLQKNNDNGTYFSHNASGSDLPFIKIAMLGLAAFKPAVKKSLKDSSHLIPTLQMLVRYAHRSVGSDSDYLGSAAAHADVYHANYLSSGLPLSTYDPSKLVRMANELNIGDVPPLVQLKVVSEDFTDGEKLFNTPGAIARKVVAGTFRAITISAEDSFDLGGNKLNHVYEWRILKGDKDEVKIILGQNKAEAKIEFAKGNAGERVDVGVFVKKQGGEYYSVPGIVSVYTY